MADTHKRKEHPTGEEKEEVRSILIWMGDSQSI